MKIGIASDHRGFAAKERARALLQERGYEVHDYGCNNGASCDYPDMALPASESVSRGETDMAILFCGTGLGMSITANKVKGIRAAVCHDELTAQYARKHNDANVLCLPADLIGEGLIKLILESWLTTKFEGGRHQRRVDKITRYEGNGKVG